jgi:hypothetical protein
MKKPLFERFPRLPSILTWAIYAFGVVIRWFYITLWHDPRKYVYSDMAMYTGLAKRLAKPGYIVNIGDITHPPGFTWLLMFFQRLDPGLQGQVYCNFVVCALLPLAVGALGWVTLGKRTGQGAVVLASLYFAFIDYGGYFLAEIHIALVATLTFVLYLAAMKLADREPTRRRTAGFIVLAALAGFLFSVAMALKMVAMPAVLGFCALHLLFSRTPRLRNRGLVLAIFLFAAAPLTAKLVHRCTVANEGHFCSGSNKSAADFLLGHYGRIESIEWRDPATPGLVVAFGSPAAYQHGYRKKETVPFLITNQKKNAEFAWKWIGDHKAEAFVLSIEHVWDCFGGSYPWPGNSTGIWPGSYLCHYLFLFVVIFPALVLLVDVLRKRGVMGLLRSVELLIVSPIIGVCVAVFVASGESRYRIPWDGVFIVLAVELYRRTPLRFGEVKEAVAVAASPGSDHHEEASPEGRRGESAGHHDHPGAADAGQLVAVDDGSGAVAVVAEPARSEAAAGAEQPLIEASRADEEGPREDEPERG